MSPSCQQFGQQHVLYDPEMLSSERFKSDRGSHTDTAFFDPAFWRERNALAGRASGRGTTYFVRDGDRVYALRHYRRGGFVGKWVRDRYVWRGLSATRPWREWHLLKWMFDAGLPVPRPLAACVVRHLCSYSADLMTLLLPDCRTLADALGEGPLPPSLWRRIGETLRRFHDQGIDHADLNAHNILLNEQGRVYLIDFDKCRQRVHSRGWLQAGSEDWKADNLSRLHRSLVKVAAQGLRPSFTPADWVLVHKAYEGLKSAVRT